MVITGKVLSGAAATAVVLFVISNPLGDSQHGLGRHNAFLANLGQSLFVASLIGLLLFVALAMTAVVQRTMRSRRARH